MIKILFNIMGPEVTEFVNDEKNSLVDLKGNKDSFSDKTLDCKIIFKQLYNIHDYGDNKIILDYETSYNHLKDLVDKITNETSTKTCSKKDS